MKLHRADDALEFVLGALAYISTNYIDTNDLKGEPLHPRLRRFVEDNRTLNDFIIKEKSRLLQEAVNDLQEELQNEHAVWK